jgi:hypothetical protein
MPATHDIQIVVDWRIIDFVGSLDAPLSHHGVGVAVTQLGDHQRFGPFFSGQQSSSRSSPTSADDEHIGLQINLRQVEVDVPQHAVPFKEIGQFVRCTHSLARPNA